MEVWKDIPGYEGLYQVSNLGRVRSLDRVTTQKNRWGSETLVTRRGRVLRPAQNRKRGGYAYVNLHAPGKKQSLRRPCVLVAEAFIGPRPEGMVVRHLDGKSSNDVATNLAWGTPKENSEDMVRHGTRQLGERHPQARLTSADVARVRAAARGMVTALAEELGVHRNHLTNIRCGLRWADGA